MSAPAEPVRWRVGTSVGRTIYVQRGDCATKRDELIGMMDTPELARLVVDAVNYYRMNQWPDGES